MEVTDYARVLRRRWVTIVVCVAAAAFIGFMTLPSSKQVAKDDKAGITYNAPYTIVSNSARNNTNLNRIALIATEGTVPQTVAKQLKALAVTPPNNSNPNAKNNNARVRIGNTTVTVVPDEATQSLKITAVSPKAENAVKTANALGDELIKYTNQTAQQAFTKQLSGLTDQSVAAQKQIDSLNDQVVAATNAKSPQLDNLKRQYQEATARKLNYDNQITQLQQQGPDDAGLATLQRAVANKVESSSGFKAPASTGPRMLVAILLGLLVGIVLALVRERFDSSVRGHVAVEDATKLPVIGEVPFMRISRRNRFIVAVESLSTSLVAESYRRLRTSIALMWMANNPPDDPKSDEILPKVLIITSPTPADGKSTTTANLAAAFAETGKSVIVIDLDYRRQKLHHFLGATVEPPLENLGTVNEPRVDLDALLQETHVPGVQFVSSASNHAAPADAVVAAQCAVQEAVKRADIVILDAPPLLLTNDTYDFIGVSDVLLLVAREGHTKRAALSRASQLLRRLDAPALGTVLVGARDDASNYYGYGYGYGGYGGGYGGYGEPKKRKLFGRKAKSEPEPSEGASSSGRSGR